MMSAGKDQRAHLSEWPFRLVTAAVLVGAIGASVRSRHRAERQGGQLRGTSGQLFVAGLRLIGLAMFLPVLGFIINPRWVRWAQIPVPTLLRWVASGVALATVPLLQWTVNSLGTNISPSHEAREGATLITHGPYQYIRHPLYSFATLAIGALLFVTRVGTLFAAVIPIAGIALRTPKEEAKLIEVFGDEYRDYLTRTGRYWPRIE